LSKATESRCWAGAGGGGGGVCGAATGPVLGMGEDALADGTEAGTVGCGCCGFLSHGDGRIVKGLVRLTNHSSRNVPGADGGFMGG